VERATAGAGHPLRVNCSSRRTVPDGVIILLINRAGSKTLQETRLLLIRHAETSAPYVFHGAESDIGLSERGRSQAGLLAEHLKTQGAGALYCSAMERAIDTARPVGAACGLEPTILPLLHERKIGPLSGQPLEQGWDVYAQSKKHWMAGDLNFTHEGGESLSTIRDRVVPIIEDLCLRHPSQTIIVIAHGIVIRVLLLSLLDDLHPDDFDLIAIDFASINDLRWDGHHWKAYALNQVVAPSPARPVV
jgi:broad specificity phosphatase PhoE